MASRDHRHRRRVYGTNHGVDPCRIQIPTTSVLRVVPSLHTIGQSGPTGQSTTRSPQHEVRNHRQLALTSITSYDSGKFYYEKMEMALPLKVINDNFYDNDNSSPRNLRITHRAAPLNSDRRLFFDERIFNINGLRYSWTLMPMRTGPQSLDCEAAIPIGCNFQNQFHQHKTSVAVYTEIAIRSPSVTLRGGLRFTHDKATLSVSWPSVRTDGV